MSIGKREVFYSVKGGQVKFMDWAITTTTLGACVEPFQVNARLNPAVGIVDFDPSDIMVKVDEMHQVSSEDAADRMLSFGGGARLHGGNAMPRVFIESGNNRGAT